VLLPSVQRRLREAVRGRKYDHVFFAPPCTTFCCTHNPQLRNRNDPHARCDLPQHLRERVLKDDRIVSFVSSLALIAHAAGVHFTIENPADRGDKTSDAYWDQKVDHCPIWLLEPMRILREVVGLHEVTFPFCAFGSDVQKYTTLWTTSPAVRSSFSDLVCTHPGNHDEVVYGKAADGSWKSASYAEYPPAMDAALASSIVADTSKPSLVSTSKIDFLHPCAAPLYNSASSDLLRNSRCPSNTAGKHTCTNIFMLATWRY
jgi:hypothetical protein